MHTTTRSFSLAVALVALGACHSNPEPQVAKDPIGGDPRPQEPVSNPEPQTSNDPVARAANDGQNTNASRTAATNPTAQDPTMKDPQPQGALGSTEKRSPLTDADVLAVMRAVNDAEIDAAEVAKKKASNAEVKQLAAMLVTHHRDAKAKEQKISQSTKLDVKDNDLSKRMKDDSKNDLEGLKAKTGKGFDMAFVDAQISAHKQALHTIDDSLMPAATNADVKKELADFRKVVDSHLTQAEGVKKRLDGAK